MNLGMLVPVLVVVAAAGVAAAAAAVRVVSERVLGDIEERRARRSCGEGECIVVIIRLVVFGTPDALRDLVFGRCVKMRWKSRII
jgi:hypothetical protein